MFIRAEKLIYNSKEQFRILKTTLISIQMRKTILTLNLRQEEIGSKHYKKKTKVLQRELYIKYID